MILYFAVAVAIAVAFFIGYAEGRMAGEEKAWIEMDTIISRRAGHG